MVSRKVYDVCVIGAGPAGLASARRLSLGGASVALLSPILEPCITKVGESLPGAAVPILGELQFDSLLATTGQLTSPGNLSAWNGSELIATDFISDPRGSGWRLGRAAFERALYSETLARGVSGIADHFRTATRSSASWQIRGMTCEIEANWVIDATGRKARFAKKQGAITKYDNRQLAVARWMECSADDTDQRTLIESVDGGWWYTAQLPNHKRVAVFHSEDRSIMTQLYKSRAAWQHALNSTKYICKHVGEGQLVDRAKLYQACGAWLDSPTGDQWLAVGDTALAFDPISSQGMFSAFYTGMRAADAILGTSSIQSYRAQLQSIRKAYRTAISDLYIN